MMTDYIFEECHRVNELVEENYENLARERLIRLLDHIKNEGGDFDPIVNHLIRLTGLFPYINIDTAIWEDRFVHKLFRVDVGLDEQVTLHRDQSLLLKELVDGNDIAVSAPTSFGKSFVIDAFIQLMQPTTVVILVPTIALADETRRRITKKFGSGYKVITTVESELAEKNILIFPQERAISYLNAIGKIDILIVDEFYKASNLFDRERSPSLINAIIKLGAKASQRYFLAPNISAITDNVFTKGMKFLKLDFSTVFLEIHNLYDEIGKDTKLKSQMLVDILNDRNSKSLVYAGTYSNIELISNLFIETYEDNDQDILKDFSDWLSENYDHNWILTKLVTRGIGIHSGRLHRAISQLQIHLFEEIDYQFNTIISTSSIVEGVNTSAENVIIWMNKNGRSFLNNFTYKNIIGRAGRMFKYFIGKIYVLASPPKDEETVLSLDFPDEVVLGLDAEAHSAILTNDQIAAIIYHEGEMQNLFGEKLYSSLKSKNSFETSDNKLLKSIAIDIKNNESAWRGLYYLTTPDVESWTQILYRILRIKPDNWDSGFRQLVEFMKIITGNWDRTIPELLSDLEGHDINIDKFFELERTLTFKFSSLMKDVSLIHRSIYPGHNIDLSNFISSCSSAFLPTVVYQLEEYGLPRMLSRKIHDYGIINMLHDWKDINEVVEEFKRIGVQPIKDYGISNFESYILEHFFDGI